MKHRDHKLLDKKTIIIIIIILALLLIVLSQKTEFFQSISKGYSYDETGPPAFNPNPEDPAMADVPQAGGT